MARRRRPSSARSPRATTSSRSELTPAPDEKHSPRLASCSTAESGRNPYDELVRLNPTPADAVARAIAFEAAEQAPTPAVCASTAITSGGYAFGVPNPGREVIEKNGAVAARVLAGLDAADAPFVSPAAVMLPTELGKVPSWHDSDSLVFYFAWLSGLSASGASWLQMRLAEPVYEPILRVANDRRTRDNDMRWPSYRAFTEILIANVAVAESRTAGKRGEGARILLQLVDTGRSLGCRAEALYADARELDRFAPTIARDIRGPLADEVEGLARRGAAIGMPRRDVELVPVRDE
jgi:hypothetical protein